MILDKTPKHLNTCKVDIWSSGGVVIKREEGKLMVVICKRKNLDVWNLPKGTPQQSEGKIETALREVREETGLEVENYDYCWKEKYHFIRAAAEFEKYLGRKVSSPYVKINKTVYFYLMKPIGGAISEHDDEHDEVIWVDVETAVKMLTFKLEKDVLKKATRRYEGL